MSVFVYILAGIGCMALWVVAAFVFFCWRETREKNAYQSGYKSGVRGTHGWATSDEMICKLIEKGRRERSEP